VKDEVKIPVSLPGAAQASADAGRVAQGLEKINKATNEQGKHSQQAAKGLNELGEATEKGAAVGRIFGEVARGNILALGQLAPVLKATGAAMKTNLVGIALIGATALVTWLQQLRGSTKDAGDAAAEAAPKMDAFAEALKKASDAKATALSEAMAEVKEQAKGAADELERVLRLQEQIAKAKGEDTPEAQRQREDMRLGAAYSAALEKRDRLAGIANTAAGDVTAIEQTLAGYQSQREQRRAMEVELRNLQRQPGGTSPEAMARGDRMQELVRMLAGSAGLNTPEQRAAEAALTKRLDPARSAAASASKAAAEADAEFQRIARGVVGLRPDGSAIPDPSVSIARGIEDRRRRVAAGIPEPAQVSGSSSEVVDGRPGTISVRGTNGEEIGNRIASAVEERVRAGEEAIARAVERQMAEVRSQLKSQRTK